MTSKFVGEICPHVFESMIGQLGEYFYKDYNVIMFFGLTEIKAQLRWMENVGVQATI